MIIQNIRTYTPGRVPLVSEILEGQLFINMADQRIYTKDNAGNIKLLGLGATAPQREVFVAGTDFTPGVSNSITLAGSYGSVSNVTVHFNGVYQSINQMQSLSGKTLTFTSNIPVGVTVIYVDSFAQAIVSTNPPVGSVGVAQLAPDTLNYFLKASTLAASTGAGLVGTLDGTVQSDITALQNIITALTTNASCATTATRPTPVFIGQACLDLQLGYTVYARQLNPPVWQNAYGVYPV